MTLKVPADSSEHDRPSAFFGEYQINYQLRALHRGTQQLRLAAKPFATLEFLIRNRHRVVPKAELLREVWGGRQEINTVEQAVRQVRKVLGDSLLEPAYIETVPGQGYRFVAEVHDPPAAEPAPGGASPRLSRRSLLVAASVGMPFVCLTGLAAVRLFRRPDHVARVTVGGRFLSALSATGRELWTYKFDAPLRDFPPDEDTWRTQIVDVDGDGIPEILVVATSARDYLSTSEQLFCFSSTGKMFWQYEPTTKVEFGTPGMNGPWKFEDVLVTSKNGAPSIWAAIVHTVWWPSFVVRLSATGVSQVSVRESGNRHVPAEGRDKIWFIYSGGRRKQRLSQGVRRDASGGRSAMCVARSRRAWIPMRPSLPERAAIPIRPAAAVGTRRGDIALQHREEDNRSTSRRNRADHRDSRWRRRGKWFFLFLGRPPARGRGLRRELSPVSRELREAGPHHAQLQRLPRAEKPRSFRCVRRERTLEPGRRAAGALILSGLLHARLRRVPSQPCGPRGRAPRAAVSSCMSDSRSLSSPRAGERARYRSPACGW